MELLAPLILAAVITAVLIPVLDRRAGRLQVLDVPGERKVHDRPIPRVGGIAMVAGAAVALAFWLEWTRWSLGYALGALVVFLFGVWDDRSNLPPWMKLVGQLLAVSIVVGVGGVEIHSITLASRIELSSWITLPLTFLFLVGVTNAINLADGLDGLAGGTSLLCFAAIVALAVGHEAPLVMTVAIVTAGSLLGFLRYNTHPARVFMGDGGSQFLGFTAGALAVSLTQAENSAYSAALPVLLLGLPILDTLTVIAVRIAQGQSPFAADQRHLHHRLLARGFDHFESVAIIYCLQASLIVVAWLMRFESDLVILGTFASVTAAVSVALLLGRRVKWQWHGPEGMRIEAVMARRLPWLKAPQHLPRWGNAIAWCCLTAYLGLTAVTSTAVTEDVAWLALGLALVLMLATLRLGPDDLTGRIAHGSVFVAAAMAVYLDHVEPSEGPVVVAAKWFLFPVLVVAVGLRLRFWRERRFEITTLDILVVFLALILPNLPGLNQAPGNPGLSIAKLIAVLYAVEMLLGHSPRVRQWTWVGTGLALGVIATRGLYRAYVA